MRYNRMSDWQNASTMELIAGIYEDNQRIRGIAEKGSGVLHDRPVRGHEIYLLAGDIQIATLELDNRLCKALACKDLIST